MPSAASTTADRRRAQPRDGGRRRCPPHPTGRRVDGREPRGVEGDRRERGEQPSLGGHPRAHETDRAVQENGAPVRPRPGSARDFRLERPPPEKPKAIGAAPRRRQRERHHHQRAQMMFLYLDSSALVKRYVDEPHSEAVGHLMDEALAIGTSAISRVEVGAALARAGPRKPTRHRRGSPSPEAVRGRLAGLRQGARYGQAPHSSRGARLEARATSIRCRTARRRPRVRANEHATRREHPGRMLRR